MQLVAGMNLLKLVGTPLYCFELVLIIENALAEVRDAMERCDENPIIRVRDHTCAGAATAVDENVYDFNLISRRGC